MKTITNIKRSVKHSIKHRAQRKYKTHKNKHAKTQLKQYKTHRGGASLPSRKASEDYGFPPTEVETQSSISIPTEVETQSDIPAEVTAQIVLPAEVEKQFGVSAKVEVASGTDFFTDILKNNININVKNVLKTTTTDPPNKPIKNILLALFITLAKSVKSKEHCGIYIGLLENQYYRRLMTNETYVRNRQGMVELKKLFLKFIENVIVHNKYRKFNGKSEDIPINQLQDWVDAIEVLLGFEAQYKPLLVSETLNLNDAQDILKKLKEHCNTQSEASNCTDFNPCCNINKENKDNNVANKSADLLVKENQTMLLQTIKLNKNESKLGANKRLIIKNNIANSMYTWLKSTDNLEAKYNLYIKSQDYKNLQITLPFKLQAGVAIS